MTSQAAVRRVTRKQAHHPNGNVAATSAATKVASLENEYTAAASKGSVAKQASALMDRTNAARPRVGAAAGVAGSSKGKSSTATSGETVSGMTRSKSGSSFAAAGTKRASRALATVNGRSNAVNGASASVKEDKPVKASTSRLATSKSTAARTAATSTAAAARVAAGTARSTVAARSTATTSSAASRAATRATAGSARAKVASTASASARATTTVNAAAPAPARAPAASSRSARTESAVVEDDAAATAAAEPRASKRPRVEAAHDVATSTEEPWEDLDAEDADDPLMVSEYVNEIFPYLQRIELEYMPHPDYMSAQRELDWTVRSVLVDWLIDIHGKFRLLPETLFLTVNIVDRFLSKRCISLNKLQLVGLTAMFIASKYEEVLCPSVGNFLFVAEGGYTDDEILRAERYMLKILGFGLSYANPMNFLRRISKADNYDIQTRTVAKYFMEISLVDYRLLDHPPSMVAAAAFWLARKVLERGEWNATLQHYSSYKVKELLPTAEIMLDYVLRPTFHHAFFKKYSARKFMRAATYVRDWAASEFPENVLKLHDMDAADAGVDIHALRLDLLAVEGCERDDAFSPVGLARARVAAHQRRERRRQRREEAGIYGSSPLYGAVGSDGEDSGEDDDDEDEDDEGADGVGRKSKAASQDGPRGFKGSEDTGIQDCSAGFNDVTNTLR